MKAGPSGSLPSVMNHSFSQVPNAEIQRSTFDRSHGYKGTFNFGVLQPIFWDEVLPGDTFALKASVFARLSTPIVPIMDNTHIDYFFFFVPNRLIWDNWQKFNGEQRNPGDSTSYLVPQITAPTTTPSIGFVEGSIYDCFGIPIKVPTIKVNALHFRAYNLIWNEWFRDQNLQNSVVNNVGDGPDAYTDYVVLSRNKQHDYFSSCLPWPQKGPAVPLPLGTSAPVYSLPLTSATANANIFQGWNAGARTIGRLGANLGAGVTNRTVFADDSLGTTGATTGGVSLGAHDDYTGALQPPFADLTNATAATINQLRQAFQIQRLYERDARGGTRYTEILKAHFGVTSPDARLQRPEYLGGGRSEINFNPIAQTGGTGASGTTTPQGNLSAFATSSQGGIGFTKSFVEHGVIIGLASARADLNYQQGIDRMWSRQTRFDFYWPALAHIGEQGVLNQEIYAGAVDATNKAVFGYQERYAEYRYKPSRITGAFRSNAAAPLDTWHLAINYASLPALNASYIVDAPPVARILAVPSQPALLFDAYFQLKCTRPMPTYSVPGMIDHF